MIWRGKRNMREKREKRVSERFGVHVGGERVR